MSDYTITYSAELLHNFLQNEVMAAEAKFEAQQTSTGASLLFSLGTDGALYLAREVTGTKSGWARGDISSAQLAKDFDASADARCKTFGSAQCPFGDTTTIHLAMVAAAGQDDHLYLSLNNPDADTAWEDDPAWTAYPFDAVDHQLAHVQIVNVFLSESDTGSSGKEYIVVDVLRDPTAPEGLLYRYYIDPAKPGGHAWQPGDLAMDVSADGYVSCLGRKVGQMVDGLYTAGQVDGVAQINYQPLYNPYGGPANPSRFYLPGGAVPTAVAASRNPSDNTSDLYLVAGDSLYCLPATNADGDDGQQEGTTASLIAENAMFAGVRTLFAAPTSDEGVIVWGLNGSDQVFYTTCESSSPVGAPWSVPLPLVTGAEQVSPYLDRVADANTFFCHTGGNKLTKVTKSPDTGLWSNREITLDPPDSGTAARDVTTYTTRVRVTDADGQPVAGLPLSIVASSVTGLHINYLSYSASPKSAIQVATDDDGSITVVEPVGTLAGAQLTITAGATTIVINPMDNAVSKVASLTTADAIDEAVITAPDGSTQPLAASGATDADKQTVATANSSLGDAYGSLSGAGLGSGHGRDHDHGHHHRRRAHHQHHTLLSHEGHTADGERGGHEGHGAHGEGHGPGVGGSLGTDIGDLLRAVGNAIAEASLDAIDVVKVEGQEVWQLAVRIGGQPFQAVLDTIESVAESAYHVLSMIVDEIEKVLAFLEFLFEWKDITRTKDALKAMMSVYFTYAIDNIGTARARLDQTLLAAEEALAAWADEPPSWAGISADTGAQMSSGTPDQSSPGSMLSYHYQNNAGDSSSSAAPPGDTPVPDDALATLFAAEGTVLYEAVEKLIDLGGRLTSMPLPDFLDQLLVIIGEATLDSARQILDAAFDLISGAAGLLQEVLEATIHIPVVSDVLNFFGVKDFSLLDVLCFVAAIPATLFYKIAFGSAPFPENKQTEDLIGVQDYASLLAMFGASPELPPGSGASRGKAASRGTAAARPGTASPHATVAVTVGDRSDFDVAVSSGGHFVAALCGGVGGALDAFECLEPPGSWLSAWAGVTSILGGASQGIAVHVVDKLVPIAPIKDQNWINAVDAILITRMAIKASGAVMPFLNPQPWTTTIPFGLFTARNWRGLTAAFDMAAGIAALVPSIYHFVELSEETETEDKFIAQLEEFSTMAAVISRSAYTFAVNSVDGAQTDWAAVVFTAEELSAVLQLGEGVAIMGTAGPNPTP